MKALLNATYKDPMASRKAALVKLHDQMLADSVTTNLTSSQLFADVCRILEEGQAWQKLAVSQNHLELMKELPSNWQVVILQHSPCRQYLYGAVLDRPEPAAKKTDKTKSTIAPPAFSKAKVMILLVTLSLRFINDVICGRELIGQ